MPSDESRAAAAIVSDAMRRVAEHMRKQYHDTSVETAFFMVASELEADALNLDPEPLVYVAEDRGVKAGERAVYALRQYLDPTLVAFDPRAGYNRNEFRYVEWVNNRERNI